MNNPRNGIIVGNTSYKIGTNITFQCNTGYTLKGNSQLLCRVDLKFDRNPPTCDVNMCPDFGVIDHARIFQATDGGIENDYGSVVKVTCEDSYVLEGHASVFCQSDGTWGPKPTCKPLDCGTFHGMNSTCVNDFVLLDTLYYMECKTDVPNTRIGADSTSAPNECEERSRKWMYSQFGCFCHCKILYNKYIVKTENLDTNDYLQHDIDLKWSCKKGCTKNQTNALRCMDGQMEMPSCTCDANIHTGEPYTTDSTTYPSVFKTGEGHMAESFLKRGDIVLITAFCPCVPDTISSYTISTRTLKLTHMEAMSICATVHYVEFRSDPWVKFYGGKMG
ncbi:hypothetical protein DPMN_152131 [Dreissena polymorpha]|uniref:Sushi domain-containing protein n=1 Tax=Dreissena polymorpha TaxID=45954 RepID=A0A9D4J3L5_DREPO|nr:hypothetical protein DPMN_152131 [Dreissena polymorpha]